MIDSQDKNKIDFLKDLIAEAPIDSELRVHGFYMEVISKETFQKIFNLTDYNVRKTNSSYVIPLTVYYKTLLPDLIDAEGNGFINDIVHLDLFNKEERLFVSYDHMEFCAILKGFFSDKLYKKINFDYKDLEIEISDKDKLFSMT